MKKQSKINLHNLSQSEVASRELSLLKGGALCMAICEDQICGCGENSSGSFPDSNAAMDAALENTELANNTMNKEFRGNNN